MKYKHRHVFEVVREFNGKISVQRARDEAGFLDDEAGEFLYGGGHGEEILTARVEILKKGKWVKVE